MNYYKALKEIKEENYNQTELARKNNLARILFAEIPKHYRYLKPIGKFGESVIYTAENTKNNEIVAVKFPFPNMGKQLQERESIGSKIIKRLPGVQKKEKETELSRYSESKMFKDVKVSRSVRTFLRGLEIQQICHDMSLKFKGIGYVPGVLDHPFKVGEREKYDTLEEYRDYVNQDRQKLIDPKLVTKIWAVYEYVLSEMLIDWCKEKSLYRKVRLFSKICVFISKCFHDNFYVHTDLNPKNILVRKYTDQNGCVDYEPVIIDFSIAKNLKLHTNDTVVGDNKFNPTFAPPDRDWETHPF